MLMSVKRNRGAKRYMTKGKRKKVLNRTGKKCAYCGRDIYETVPETSPIFLTIDHIKPISKGGPKSNISNLVCACNECNGMKANMFLHQFRKMLAKGYRFYFEEIGNPSYAN